MRNKQAIMDGFVEKIYNAGIVGQGGGGFPSYIKLKTRVGTVIANAVECEPLIKSDYWLIQKHPEEFISGLKLLRDTVGAERSIIALKKKNSDLIELLEPLLDSSIEITTVQDYYPAGDEVMLIHSVLEKIVPAGKIPPDIGVVVHNAGTLVSYHYADHGEPFTSRFVTVTGAVKKPVTARLPLGTPFSFLLKLAGGSEITNYCILEGGVMMGRPVTENNVVTKTTTGIVVLPSHHPAAKEISSTDEWILKIARSVCDQCYACSEVCPRLQLGHNIEPHKIMRMMAFQIEPSAVTTSVPDFCCECGLCSLFACPLGISPRRIISKLKKENRADIRAIRTGKIDPLINYKRIPSNRLMLRLGLDRYDIKENQFIDDLPPIDKVKIPLRQHPGAPAVPVVKNGDRVKIGERIANAADDPLSLPVHASIDGTVIEVNENEVVISAG